MKRQEREREREREGGSGCNFLRKRSETFFVNLSAKVMFRVTESIKQKEKTSV